MRRHNIWIVTKKLKLLLYIDGNISDANQYFRINYGNFNLGHQINIQGEGRKVVRGEDLQKCDCPIQRWVQIVKLPNPPCSLDVDPMT